MKQPAFALDHAGQTAKTPEIRVRRQCRIASTAPYDKVTICPALIASLTSRMICRPL
jgi:hypothetical protein